MSLTTTNASQITGEMLYCMWKAVEGRSKQDVANLMNMTYGQVGGKIWRWQQKQSDNKDKFMDEDLFDIQLDTPLELEGDAVIISDVQAPTVNIDIANRVIPAAQYFEVQKKLVILGDFINADWRSSYPTLTSLPSGRYEIETAQALIKEWLTWFEEIYWFPGNHEDRWLKDNAGHLDMVHLKRLLGPVESKIITSNLDHCWLNTKMGKWFLCHGTSYSVDQLKYANDMAQKYQAHVLIGHQHHLAMGWDRFKRYIIIDNGGLFEPDKMAYVKMRANKRPNMMQGFTIIKDGYPHLLGPEPYTDWRKIL